MKAERLPPRLQLPVCSRPTAHEDAALEAIDAEAVSAWPGGGKVLITQLIRGRPTGAVMA